MGWWHTCSTLGGTRRGGDQLRVLVSFWNIAGNAVASCLRPLPITGHFWL